MLEILEMEKSLSSAIYRGKRYITHEWVYGHLLIRKNKSYIATSDALDFMVVDNGMATMKLIEVDPATVGIYTLYNDCHDIKVFTGDVLETTTGARSIYTNEFRVLALFNKYTGMYYADGFCYVNLHEFRFCRVVGNIYDNPELLDTIDLDDMYMENPIEGDPDLEQFLAGCDELLSGGYGEE